MDCQRIEKLQNDCNNDFNLKLEKFQWHETTQLMSFKISSKDCKYIICDNYDEQYVHLDIISCIYICVI